MICPNCKREISKDDKFCGYCGERINFKTEEKSNYPKVPDKYRVERVGYPKKRWTEKYKEMSRTLSRHLRPIFFISIALLILWVVLSGGEPETRKFSPLAEPKIMTFEWEYEGSKYSITETFHGTVYNYYNSSPEKHCWFKEEENYESCLKEFLEEAEEDNTISKIASDIKAAALENRLRGDELLELTVAFVQSIPYDWDKAKFIVSLPEFYYDVSELEPAYPRYPYEVLYDNKGVCTGKTFLAISLIKELDYGIASFSYEAKIADEVGHIVPAVKCPIEYSSYNSGYCYTEVTERGFKIGELPQIDIDTKIPKARVAITPFEKEKKFELGGLELGRAEIYEVAEGNSYQGIINTVQTIQRIETLEKEINGLYWVIGSLEKELKQLENSVNYYEQQSEAAYSRHLILQDYASYNEYNRLYSKYESAYSKYESRANEHDREVAKYNNFVYEYNALIEDFYE